MEYDITNERKLKVSPPWCTYANKVKALFEKDEEVLIHDLDEDHPTTLVIEVSNHSKFLAMKKLFPNSKKFGNITLFIEIHDTSVEDEKNDYFYLFTALFEGNKSASKVIEAEDVTGTEHVFVVFKPEVKQFFDDNLFDFHGFWSGLAQDIAAELFEDATESGVHFCTAEVRED